MGCLGDTYIDPTIMPFVGPYLGKNGCFEICTVPIAAGSRFNTSVMVDLCALYTSPSMAGLIVSTRHTQFFRDDRCGCRVIKEIHRCDKNTLS